MLNSINAWVYKSGCGTGFDYVFAKTIEGSITVAYLTQP
jgi:hypothetical protein